MLVPQGVGKHSAGYFPTHRSLLLVATTPKPRRAHRLAHQLLLAETNILLSLG